MIRSGWNSASRKVWEGDRPNQFRGLDFEAAIDLLLALNVAKSLGDEFDIEICEMHHRMKVDAPSGTALMLGEAAAEGRGVDLKAVRVSTRDGHTGARKPGDIGFATLRGGSVVGGGSSSAGRAWVSGRSRWRT